MDGDHCRDRLSERPVDIAARLAVAFAFGFQVLAQFRRIHRVRASVHVDEIWLRACLGNRFCGGDESVGNRDNNVARLYACACESKAQSVGAAADANAMLCIAVCGKLSFKSLHGGSANTTSGSDASKVKSHEPRP